MAEDFLLNTKQVCYIPLQHKSQKGFNPFSFPNTTGVWVCLYVRELSLLSITHFLWSIIILLAVALKLPCDVTGYECLLTLENRTHLRSAVHRHDIQVCKYNCMSPCCYYTRRQNCNYVPWGTLIKIWKVYMCFVRNFKFWLRNQCSLQSLGEFKLGLPRSH